MDLLTKKIYQNPKFYTELYDKPVNIDRKEVAMRAIGLMQKRDFYRSIMRSEAIMAVWLETATENLQDDYTNETDKATDEGRIIELP
jgi:predicted GNAT superfamily acetyltransferase